MARSKTFGIERKEPESDPSKHSTEAMISVFCAQIAAGYAEGTANPRSELDSHANMMVVGKNAFVFESTGRTCNAKPFSEDLGLIKNIPIVDAAIAYDCPYTHVCYILLLRNALYLPSLEHNLLVPFIMREGGVKVNDRPKIHSGEPTVSDYCLEFPNSDLRIPLQLLGTFSYFHSRLPNIDELYSCDKLFITPDADDWNPHCDSYEMNERSILNYEGEITDPKNRTRRVMGTIDEGEEVYLNASVEVDAMNKVIDATISSAFTAPSRDTSNTSFDADLADCLSRRAEVSKVQASIGSCNISDDRNCPIFDEPMLMKTDELENILSSILGPVEMQATLDAVVATMASKPKGTDSETLSKLWYISDSLAEGAIEANTQLRRYNAENTLSRNFSTNDRMLRYRRIQSVFYTDTMFSTPKAKSTRQNVCCQVFVSDEGYVAVYPMKSQAEFPTVLHWFCKHIGVPTTLVVDGHKAQTSGEVKRFCDQVGTTLRILEIGTP